MFLLILFVFLLGLGQAGIRQTPVIGIYTQDSDYPGHEDKTYISASYVKIIESAGGQAIPIFYTSTEAQLADLLPQLNGVLFPGGEMPIDIKNLWTSNIAFILDWAVKENNKGRVFPIWATCLGYEAIAVITSLNPNNMSTLTEVHGEQGPRKLINLDRSSTLYKTMPPRILDKIESDDGLFYFHHRWAVTPLTFKRSVPLTAFWKLVSTSTSPTGEEFVSTLEAKSYPFFLTQYHPEKNSFEWRVPAVRTYEGIFAELRVFNIFVDFARKSENEFKNPDQLQKSLIWNYPTLYTTEDYDFVQMYFFEENISLNQGTRKMLKTE